MNIQVIAKAKIAKRHIQLIKETMRKESKSLQKLFPFYVRENRVSHKEKDLSDVLLPLGPFHLPYASWILTHIAN